MDTWIRDYKYDAKGESWCRLTFSVPVSDVVVDPNSVIEAELKKSVLYQVPSIKRAFLIRDKDKLIMKTEGVNFDYLMRFDKILDMTKLFSNDIQAVAGRFGIEAAMKTIIRVRRVYCKFFIISNVFDFCRSVTWSSAPMELT